uniref:Uncharacterized protein n=1 Tax=Candidozyma auris TaxID=498019 RepID=A0A0L0NYG6_CANAR
MSVDASALGANGHFLVFVYIQKKKKKKKKELAQLTYLVSLTFSLLHSLAALFLPGCALKPRPGQDGLIVDRQVDLVQAPALGIAAGNGPWRPPQESRIIDLWGQAAMSHSGV